MCYGHIWHVRQVVFPSTGFAVDIGFLPTRSVDPKDRHQVGLFIASCLPIVWYEFPYFRFRTLPTLGNRTIMLAPARATISHG